MIKKAHQEIKVIFLCGSFINNSYTPFSNMDLYFILNGGDHTFTEPQDHFIGYFQDILLDVNIVVYMIREIDKMKKTKNKVIREVLEGIGL